VVRSRLERNACQANRKLSNVSRIKIMGSGD
jgi:hypothetical protein